MSTQPLGTLTVDAIANTGSYVQNMNKADEATKKFSKSAKNQKADLDKLIGSIDPTIAAYGRLDKIQTELNKHAQSGAIDPELYEDLTKKVQLQRIELEKNASVMQGNAKTSRELAFAMRNLPAQFTDIFVSLQGGQAPLTVLLQQGGQLKDMFGGIGPAFRVMGSYVLGLLNPLTIMLATLGTAAVGFVKATNETQAFNRILATTGNQAGTTSAELQAMAEGIDDVVGTQAKASAVLVQLAASGKFVVAQFDEIATAAIRYERATGTAVEDTIEKYEELAEDPVEAIIKLNEEHGFLTAAIFKQIQALAEEGKETEAAALAMDTFTAALSNMADQVEESESKIYQVFGAISDAAKETADSLASIFRPSNVQQDISNLTQQLNRLYETGASQSRIDAIQAQITLKREELDVEVEIARVAAEEQRNLQAGIVAQQDLNEMLVEGQTDAEKLAASYAEIEKNLATARAAGFAFTDEQVEALRAAARAEFDKPADEEKESEAQRMVALLQEQQNLLLEQSFTNDKLTATRKELIKFESEIARIKNKEILTADEQSLLNSEELIRQQLEFNVTLENGLEYVKQTQEVMKNYSKMYEGLLTDEEKSVALTAERLRLLQAASEAGLSEAENAEALARILDQAFKESPDLTGLTERTGDPEQDKFAKGRRQLQEWYDSQMQMLDMYREEHAERVEEWDAKELEIMTQFNEQAQALNAASFEAQNEQYEEFAKEAARNMQDAMADFLFDPFDEGLEGMVKSFATMLRRLAAEQAAADILKWASGTNWGEAAAGLFKSAFGGARAEGGPVDSGKAYLVGERGPELWVPNQSGYIIDNETTSKMGGGGVNQVFNIQTPDANSFRQSTRQVARAARQGLAR